MALKFKTLKYWNGNLLRSFICLYSPLSGWVSFCFEAESLVLFRISFVLSVLVTFRTGRHPLAVRRRRQVINHARRNPVNRQGGSLTSQSASSSFDLNWKLICPKPPSWKPLRRLFYSASWISTMYVFKCSLGYSNHYRNKSVNFNPFAP